MDENRKLNGMESLFEQPLEVVSVGLEGFANELAQQQVSVVHLDWRPPAEGDAELADLASKLGA